MKKKYLSALILIAVLLSLNYVSAGIIADTATYWMHNESDSQFAAYHQLRNASTELAMTASAAVSTDNPVPAVRCWNNNWISPNFTSITSLDGIWNFSLNFTRNGATTAYLFAKIFKLNSTGRFDIANSSQSANVGGQTANTAVAWGFNLTANSLTNLSIGERAGIQFCLNITARGATPRTANIYWENSTRSFIAIPFLHFDFLPPNVNIIYPQNTDYNINITALNYGYSDINPGSCWYSRDGGAVNSTNVIAGTNFTGVTSAEGSNIWSVYCNDTSGNVNSTSVIFTKDTIYPQINFTFPTPANGTFTSSTSIEINVSINEANLNEVKFNWNGTNFTIYNDSLVLMMNFDNLSFLGENATRVADASKYGNNGAAVGAVINSSSGKYGLGGYFDGTNDYINLSNPQSLNLTNKGFTISAWINPKAGMTGNWYYNIIAKDSLYKNGTGIEIHGSYNRIEFWIRNSTKGITYSVWNYGSISNIAGNWIHIAGVYNMSKMHLYIDGTLKDSDATVVSPFFSSSDWRIGHAAGALDKYFNGTIDEVRIWNRSLSGSEIYQIYASNLQKYNQTQWHLYVNQSKNAIAGLDIGTYTYSASAKDNFGNENMADVRYANVIAADKSYPQFSAYWDNGGIREDSTAYFRVNIENTNGTAILNFDGINYSAINQKNILGVNITSGNDYGGSIQDAINCNDGDWNTYSPAWGQQDFYENFSAENAVSANYSYKFSINSCMQNPMINFSI